MKAIVILAALLAAVCAQNTTSTGNSTGVTGNITSTSTGFTGNTTGVTGNTTTTTSTTGNSTTSTGVTSTTTSTGNTTGVTSTGNTTGSSTTSTTSSSTTTTTTGSSTAPGTTGVPARPITVESKQYANNSCFSPPVNTFTSSITPDTCSRYDVPLPQGNTAYVVARFDGDVSVTIWLYFNDANCANTPVASNVTFRNDVCGTLNLNIGPVYLSNKWSTSATSTSSSTTDANAAVSRVPSFIAIAFATLLLLARFC
eukprot:TRINITY_DN22374_c1_g1_i1.p1 TRINITY_DN22374_c1_g1~~TRINITY_DN22374_c1_g1_i1.p1  ORF type:complete len:256 (-),score=92.81 TRINITY_DN22374_c1_g1_i1:294-1061(-)